MSSKPYVFRIFTAHARLFISVIISVLAGLLLPVQGIERSIIAWNIGTIVYLCLVAKMMLSSNQKKMEIRADEDEGKYLILILALLAVVFSLVTITYELVAVKKMSGDQIFYHIGLVALTIFSSWFFIHTVYALHYAHEYYDKVPGGYARGLIFPETKSPDYADFLYFSFIIGTSAQTADVNISSQSMRRLSLFHCVIAFFFNTTILALTINIASSLF
ncbi:MAG: DUF1345 domain-containing protein [Bdellovibrionaceae bacterium]|nr:DUF1345 domain-containing protein [Pseudobdellovibrionaceae bacterium]